MDNHKPGYYKEYRKRPKVAQRRRLWNRTNYKNHKDEIKAYKAAWYKKHRKRLLRKFHERMRIDKNFRQSRRDYVYNHRKRLRSKIFDILGWSCACCGESHREFLCIDHIHGGGNKHQRSAGGSWGVIRDIVKDPNIKDKYRTLCFNCNNSLGLLGYCPHADTTG